VAGRASAKCELTSRAADTASAQVSFVVTATQTITITIPVSADGGVSAVGQIPVVTIVTDNPSRAWRH